MSKELVLAELLTSPGARECKAAYKPSKVGVQSPPPGGSGCAEVQGASQMRRFNLLPDVGAQGLPPDDRGRGRYGGAVSSCIRVQRLFSDVGCTALPGVEGARNSQKLVGFIPAPFPRRDRDQVVPSVLLPPPPHPGTRVEPVPTPARDQSPRSLAQPANRVTAVARRWLRPPQAAGAGLSGSEVLRCFCCLPSPVEPSRTQPNVAEPSRTPHPGRRRRPSAAERASEPPQPRRRHRPWGRRCQLAADRPRQRPLRSRRGGSGRRRLRGRGGGPGEVTSPLPASSPPLPSRRLLSLSRRPASRSPGPSRGRAHRAQLR